MKMTQNKKKKQLKLEEEYCLLSSQKEVLQVIKLRMEQLIKNCDKRQYELADKIREYDPTFMLSPTDDMQLDNIVEGETYERNRL